MAQRLTEPWFQPADQTIPGFYGAHDSLHIPGQFPIEEDEAGESPDIYELPGDVPSELNGGDVRAGHSTQPAASSHNPSVISNSNPGRARGSNRKVAPRPTTLGLSQPSSSIIPKPIVIAVFGLTGTGKSSFISKLTGKAVQVGHGLHSCTSGIEEVHCKIGDCSVTLVDTPGFDDTTLSDTEVLTMIASYLKDSYDDKTRLSGVIYLHRISDNRVSGSSYKNLKMLRSLCGTNNLDHVTLASTMWDKVTEREGNDRETELLTDGKFWGDLKKYGSRVRRYDGTSGGALLLVNELLQLSPIVLKIQKEIAIEKKTLIETAAGQSVNETLIKLTKKHEEEMALVREDLNKALKENNITRQQELEADILRITTQLKRHEENRKTLRAPINRRAWWRLSWKCQNCGARLQKSRDGSRSSPKGTCPGCGVEQMFV